MSITTENADLELQAALAESLSRADKLEDPRRAAAEFQSALAAKGYTITRVRMTDTQTFTLIAFLESQLADDKRLAFTQREHREVDAKRAILMRHEPATTFDITVCDYCEGSLDYPCPDVRTLATIYADHPDYRDEWRLTPDVHVDAATATQRALER